MRQAAHSIRSSAQIAADLIRLDRSRGKRLSLLPLIYGVGNLLFCGFMDSRLRSDPAMHDLFLFFFLEGFLILSIAAGHFITNDEKVIVRTRIFPTTSLSRMMYLVAGNGRRPAVAAVLVTAMLFLCVLFRDSPWLLLSSLLLFALMAAGLMAIHAAAGLMLIRGSQPPEGMALMIVLLAIGVVAGSLMFRYDFLLEGTPVTAWAAAGMLAARTGDLAGLARNAGFLAATLAGALAVGRRFG